MLLKSASGHFVMRVSYGDNIADQQLASAALVCERYDLDFAPSVCRDRRVPEESIWSEPEQDRHLDKGLFYKLDETCHQLTGLDRHYVPLVILLLVETGLRLDELCAVRWDDVSLRKRRMEIAKPRWPYEDEARTIVLAVRTRWYLEQVELALREDGRFDSLAPVIPMTPADVRKAFGDVVKRAQVVLGESLFDALHCDAEARFKEAGLTKTERDIMLGSAMRVLPGSQEDLTSIEHKLDRYLLCGRLYEQAKDSIPILSPASIVFMREKMASLGMLRIPEASPTVIRHFPNVVLNILGA